MSPADLKNGTTGDLFYPAGYGAEIQLEVLRPDDREALHTRLAELRGLPREQWEKHGATELSPKLPGTYMVFFGADGIAWVVPQADARFRVDGLGSQKTLRDFEREAEEQDAGAGEGE